mmetsp:Transcript_29951/g.93275  ORF Transcript_29951/g.93275 Transcript_29951/m.93275 type:complete len:232 (+) Transcript_29951:255-950(+)
MTSRSFVKKARGSCSDTDITRSRWLLLASKQRCNVPAFDVVKPQRRAPLLSKVLHQPKVSTYWLKSCTGHRTALRPDLRSDRIHAPPARRSPSRSKSNDSGALKRTQKARAPSMPADTSSSILARSCMSRNSVMSLRRARARRTRLKPRHNTARDFVNATYQKLCSARKAALSTVAALPMVSAAHIPMHTERGVEQPDGVGKCSSASSGACCVALQPVSSMRLAGAAAASH